MAAAVRVDATDFHTVVAPAIDGSHGTRVAGGPDGPGGRLSCGATPVCCVMWNAYAMGTDARIAPRRMRLLAGVIDTAAGLLGMVAVMIVTVGGAFAYMKLRGDREPSKENAPGTAREFWKSAWWRSTLQVATLAFAPVGRNWRGPGYRVLGLRRVDARTGGAVSIRSAVVGAMFDSAWQPATNSLVSSRLKREMDRVTALEPQLSAIKEKYAVDADAQHKALMQFYKTNRVSPLPACAWSAGPVLLVQLLVLLFSRQGRTLRDRVTRTVVIVDR